MTVTTQISNIVLADDDEDDCLLFQDVILDLNIIANITIARHGEELLQILQKYNGVPEVIFLDMNMPLLNGLECLKEIRRSPNLKNIPVIILSTSSHSQTVEDVFKEGANLYIRKPDSFDKLRSILENILIGGTANLAGREKGGFLITE
jgi:CheY-like chemotaxis protein